MEKKHSHLRGKARFDIEPVLAVVNGGFDAEAFVINNVGGPVSTENPLAYLPKELELGSSRALYFSWIFPPNPLAWASMCLK